MTAIFPPVVVRLCMLLFTCPAATAQSNLTKKIVSNSPAVISGLRFTDIPGAPKLGDPQLIMGATKPVIAEGMGFAAPAYFDVNNDGKNDLLLGEFGSRLENNGMAVGNFVRVYKNKGTNEVPAFEDFYEYLQPAEEYSKGTPLSVYTWCCLGFTPKIADLDNDGFEDIITGQFNPGFVTWFRGTKNGFENGKHLPQFGDPMVGFRQRDYTLSITDPASNGYWTYSAVDFGDFEGKGLQDMIIGGSALRISRNIGTQSDPRFGRRELLLDINGNPLKAGAWDTMKGASGESRNMVLAVPTVADWDGDGLPDILVTDAYTHTGDNAVTFFKAAKTGKGLRFEPGVPLFTAENGKKAFPGSWLRVSVTDWNNDGIKDLLIGTSIVTLNGKYDAALSWEWEEVSDIVKKNPAYYSDHMTSIINSQLKYADSLKVAMNLSDEELEKQNKMNRKSLFGHYYVKEEYKKMAHQGYVYVLLGSRNKLK